MLVEILTVVVLILQVMILHEVGHVIAAGRLFIGFRNSLLRMHPMAFVNKMTVGHFLLYAASGLLFSLPIAILSAFLLEFPYDFAVLVFWFAVALADVFILFAGSIYIIFKKIDLRKKIEDIEPGLWKEF